MDADTPEPHDTVEYLPVFGRLSPDNQLTLRPGYTTVRPTLRDQISGTPILVAEVRAADDRVLVRTPLPVLGYCGSTTGNLAVRGYVPLPAAARRIRFLRNIPGLHHEDPIIVADITVPESAPTIRLTSRIPQNQQDSPVRVTWRAGGEPAPVQFRVVYSHTNGAIWIPVVMQTTETSALVDLSELPGGSQCRIAIRATNGIRSAAAISDSFPVALKPCRALIQQPPDHAELSTDAAQLIGNGWWLEANAPELEDLHWHSSIDGELGRGRTVQIALSPGEHVLTLTAGSGDRAGTSSVNVHVASGTNDAASE